MLHTLLEAFILVSLVVYLILGDIRSTLIPVLAVPVSLINAFFFMLMFGLSINLITLFALVLAIGVVVDDAIVVVEAVHEKMHTKHLGPYQATQEVMHEISGAIIAITMTMTAVFVPVTFMTGPVGVFYRQFGLTMAMSIVLSGLVALTLTPVLCAMILRPHTKHQEHGPVLSFLNRCTKGIAGRNANVLRNVLAVLLGLGAGYGFYYLLNIHIVHELVSEQFPLTEERTKIIAGVMALLFILTFRSMLSGSEPSEKKIRGPLGMFLHFFNQCVEKVTSGHAGILRLLVPRRVFTMLVVSGFGYGIFFVNGLLPSGFIPLEDQGVIYGIIQTPTGSTLEYTNSKSHELQDICKEFDEITTVSSIAGYEILTQGRGSNAGTCLINLKPWAERKLTSKEIIEELEKKGAAIANVKLEFYEPPAVPGFGAAGGFSLNLLDKTNSNNYAQMGEVTDKFMAAFSNAKS